MAFTNDLAEFISQIEAWEVARKSEAEGFHLRGFSRFVEQMNYRTRRLVAITDRHTPEFWSAVAELATNAQTLVTKGAKLRADHQDMTNL